MVFFIVDLMATWDTVGIRGEERTERSAREGRSKKKRKTKEKKSKRGQGQ